MFANLLDFIKDIGTPLLPCIIVKEWEEAIRLRWGKYHSTLSPGFHWMWPLVDSTVTQSVAWTTTVIKAQSVQAMDESIITAESIVRWRISNTKDFSLKIWDGKEVVVDTLSGAIADAIYEHGSDRETVQSTALEAAQAVLTDWGIEVSGLQCTTLAPVRVIRLVGMMNKVEGAYE